MIGAMLVTLVVVIPFLFVGMNTWDEEEIRRQLHQRGHNTQVDYLAGNIAGIPYMVVYMRIDLFPDNPSMLRPVMVILLVIVAFVFWLSIVIFCTVKKAYSYIKQKRWAGGNATVHVFVAVPQADDGTPILHFLMHSKSLLLKHICSELSLTLVICMTHFSFYCFLIGKLQSPINRCKHFRK